jgi:protein phosphatase
VGAATDAGVRPENQDRAGAGPWWAVVSDGVGGENGGARAARLTVDAVAAALASLPDPVDRGVPALDLRPPPPGSPTAAPRDDAGARDDARVGRAGVAAALVDGTRRAHGAVRAGRAADPSVGRMAATLTAAAASAVGPDGSRWVVASVGDSPAWHVGAAGATRVTVDHTLAGELLRAGAISPAEAAAHPGRHTIVRSIGGDGETDPDLVRVELRPGEALVLASDGVSDVLDDDAVAATLADGGRDLVAGGDPQAAADRLVTAALAAGTTDNATAVVVHHAGGHGRARGRR